MSDDRPAAGATARPPNALEAGGMGRTRHGARPALSVVAAGLLEPLVNAAVRRAHQVLGNTAAGAAQAAAPACSICGQGARKGLHVAPVFRLRAATGPDAPDFLLVPVDHAGRQARPLCLACATSMVAALTVPELTLEVEA